MTPSYLRVILHYSSVKWAWRYNNDSPPLLGRKLWRYSSWKTSVTLTSIKLFRYPPIQLLCSHTSMYNSCKVSRLGNHARFPITCTISVTTNHSPQKRFNINLYFRFLSLLPFLCSEMVQIFNITAYLDYLLKNQ